MSSKNKVFISCPAVYLNKWKGIRALLTRSVKAALEYEGIPGGCEVNILCTDLAEIKRINNEQRGIDRETDVLSFPMLDLLPGEKPDMGSVSDVDPETGLIMLGDIVLSFERSESQAEEYGHSFEREVSYLTVHSVLHLLGYDHEEGLEAESEMNKRAEEIMKILGLER